MQKKYHIISYYSWKGENNDIWCLSANNAVFYESYFWVLSEATPESHFVSKLEYLTYVDMLGIVIRYDGMVIKNFKSLAPALHRMKLFLFESHRWTHIEDKNYSLQRSGADTTGL